VSRQRTRYGDRVRRILAEAIQTELGDPRVGFVTLQDVKLSPDKRYAVVYVTILNSEDNEKSLSALNHAVPFLRRLLARRAGLRHTPKLRFVSDEVLERNLRLEQIFHEFRTERPEEADES